MALPQRYVEKDFYTEAEYLAWEEDALRKSEYVGGEIRMMSGGTSDHGLISANVIGALWAALRGSACRVMSADMKVLSGDGSLRYPDASVVCGAFKYHGPGRLVLANPLVLVEVLSPGTENTDRGEKLLGYQAIESLQSYLLVEQRMARIEQYTRMDNGEWKHQTVRGLESALVIPALNITLALADIYEGIDFEAKRSG